MVKAEATRSSQISAALFYVIISIATTFFNKAVLSIWNFKFASTILLLQHIFTLIILEGLKLFGFISYPRPELSKCKELLPVSLLYSLNVGVALSALKSLNIPMYGVMKRLTTLFTLIGEFLILGKKSSPQLQQSTLVIVAGALIAGSGDITFDLLGYILATGSCIAQTAYLIYVAKTGIESGMSSVELLFYNSLLAIPFVFGAGLLFGEYPKVLVYPDLFDLSFQGCLLGNLVLGICLNYSLFLCTTLNSALTTTIMGHVKNGLSVLLSLFLLGGVTLTQQNIVGLTINLTGGIWYSAIKYNEKKKRDSERKFESAV
eukprot:TRINITY_DN12848_c0_g1_i1.p1 TRINITY_DN12848_c0_g1~~TRINITY_DN12848_c0_g1_i1.p1  ORF type:complete len:318 (+),score=65.01 TRINITY_DN12848_c0_g1_i1:50-1003(+)